MVLPDRADRERVKCKIAQHPRPLSAVSANHDEMALAALSSRQINPPGISSKGETVQSEPTYEQLQQKIRQLEAQLQRLKEDNKKDEWVQQEFKRLAERSKDGIYRFDLAARRFVFFNKKGIEMFGSKDARLSDITPRSMLLRIHPDDLATVRRAARESLQPGRNGGEAEYRYLNPEDGSYSWNYDRWLVMRDAAGEPQYLEGIVIDDTNRKLAEEALRESRKKLRRLSSYLLKAQERERRRISLELHDELGQALTALKLQIGSIKKKLSADEPSLREDCEHTLKYVDQIIENVRRLSHDLSPSILEDLGLDASLRLLLKEFAKHSNLTVRVDAADVDGFFSSENQVIIYRIFQEALTNIEKHAEAAHIWVTIKHHEGRVTFRIRDDGRGFDVKQPLSKSSDERVLGLTAMDERARMLGGKLSISSQKGKGTEIVVEIPTDAARDQDESLSYSLS
jgi:PAS domain S-box-containing protein